VKFVIARLTIRLIFIDLVFSAIPCRQEQNPADEIAIRCRPRHARN
jgi:hypothetical protein